MGFAPSLSVTCQRQFDKRGMGMRASSRWAAVVASMLVVVSVAPISSAAALGGATDRARNKIFDSLDRMLESGNGDELVDVVVLFSAGSSKGAVAAAWDEVGPFSLDYQYQTMPAFAAKLSAAQVRALALRPDVVQVQENARIEFAMETAQASAGSDRASAEFSVDGNNEASLQCPGVRQYCKDDVVIAVLDSGIDNAHVDLDGGKVLGGADCSTGTCTNGLWMADTNGHGTHVASIAAGEGDGDPAKQGLAPGAALVSVKVGSSGSTVAALDASLEWVLANRATYGIELVNMSLNGKVTSDGTDTTSRLTNRLAAAGVTPFAAMGNGAPEPGSVSFPAAAKFGLGIGNMADPGPQAGQLPGFALSMSSKRGPTLDGRIKPDLLSYGVNISAADANSGSGYTILSGTSQASPFAAGVAALMLDANPALASSGLPCAADDLSTDCSDGVIDASMSVGLRDGLMSTAIDWAGPGHDNETGAGRLDAYAAVDAASTLVGAGGPALPTHTFVGGNVAPGGTVDHSINVSAVTAPIAATVIMVDRPAGATTPDLNLTLVGPAGNQLSHSATAGNLRQETVGAWPQTTGTYVVRVTSVSGGGSYWLDISFSGGGVAPEPSPTMTQPPLAPAGLSAAPVSGSSSQIDLVWGDVTGEKGYKIERSADGLSGWTQIATSSVDASAHRDSGLAPSTKYHYRVRAYNDAGDSPYSGSASATTNPDTMAPTSPLNIKATGGRGKVSLTWTASTDSGGSGLAGYKIMRATSSAGPFTQIATTTATTYTDAAVTKGKVYYYYLLAYDKAGNNSSPSATVTGKPT